MANTPLIHGGAAYRETEFCLPLSHNSRKPVVQVRALHPMVYQIAEAAPGSVDAPILVPIVASVVIGLGFTVFISFGLKPGAEAQEKIAEASKKGWNGPLKTVRLFFSFEPAPICVVFH